MDELLACRVCLATDNIKLYSFFKYQLSHAYEILTGSQISVRDGLPQHICSYCSTLLLKCVTFREKCCNSQDLLKYCLNEQSELSMNYLRSLNREVHELILPYTINNTVPTISCEHDELPIKEERETEVFTYEFEDIKVERDDKQTIKRGKGRRKKKQLKDSRTPFDKVTVKCEDATRTQEVIETNADQPIESAGDQTLEQATDQTLTEVEGCVHDDVDETHEAIYDSDTQDPNDFQHLKDVKIVNLTRQEQLQEIEARKTSFNYINSAYKCDKCYKGFITDSTYKNHMQRHDPRNGAYECDICFSRWPESRSLRAHTVNSHKRKFICRICDYVSRSSHRAKEHCKWHSGFTFDCKICGASFAKSTSHLTHIRLQHPSNHSCEICGESFIGEFGLRMHKKRAHRDRDSSAAEPCTCGQCAAEFCSVAALARHLGPRGRCDPALRPCGQCGEGFPSNDELQEHVKLHRADTEGAVHCDDCRRSFTSEKSYAIHYQRVHLGVKLKQRKPSLRRPADSAVCEVCGKKCITKATLRYHQRIHTGERPYQCSECPKKFSVFQRLQIHIRTHTGESPYQCKHCPKAFKHKAALNRHDRVHTGAKPYMCSHCGKTFSQSNSMKLHVNTVHLKLPAPYRSRRTNKN